MSQGPIRVAMLFCLALGLAAGDPAAGQVRLPDGVRPTRCALDLTIFPDREAFDGRIRMDIELRQTTRSIRLNAHQLDISEAVFTPQHGPRVRAVPHPERDPILELGFQEPLRAGKGVLELTYRGRVSRTDTAGIFAQREGGNWYAISQFESVSARRAFPCFDEPGFKVPWQVTLTVPQADMAVSNTPVLKSCPAAPGMSTYTFKETAPLPSYLVAFAVGPFDVVKARAAGRNHTPLRILVPKGCQAEAKDAVACIPELLERLEDYFGRPYPSEKLDSLVIPSAGFAMENPGLITYARGMILSPPETAGIAFRRDLASVAAHEMAHQWFGDLVTMAWWDDTWLNEAFATWLSTKIVDQWQPAWEWKQGESQQVRTYTMEQDALASARQVCQPINSLDDIENAFDGITYEKGGGLITMFEAEMGPDRFRAAVRAYMAGHANRNATTREFLGALAKVGGPWIPAAFRSFLDQPGTPELDCSLGADRGHAVLRLVQSRFLPLGSKADPNRTWKIPVAIRYRAHGQVHHLRLRLGARETRQVLPVPLAAIDYLLVNEGMEGYYRVRYDRAGLERLLNAEPGALSKFERIGLLQDVSAAAKAGHFPLDEALGFIARFRDQSDRQTVDCLADLSSNLTGCLLREPNRPATAAFLRDMFGARCQALGLQSRPGDSDDSRQLRRTLVSLVGIHGEDPGLRAEARQLAQRWLEDRSSLAPDMAPVVLEIAAGPGDLAFFDRLLAEARRTPNPQEAAILLGALGSFQDPALRARALGLILSDDFDPQQSISILSQVASDDRSLDLAYQFLKDHYDAILNRIPREWMVWVPACFSRFSDPAHRADLEAFLRPRAAAIPGAPRVLDQILEGIDLHIARRAAQQGQVDAFLRGGAGKGR